ncbi:fused MFS/spermidine synthase [Undibacterium jejuense]|uniref:Fused MFS/spermidine synthase n=1 Tax=Undibacterium jejuense TaxID=1344949 RepID=A0A923HG09_9BURK|nr:fused MFS/spermidine synthase [Undibacterium jejuense]MBC3863857.1 fused MFS/spermidine synthase [Undibacterium jejuense]
MNISTQQNGAADYRFAKNFTLIITIIFLIGAACGINSWPYQAIIHNSNQSIISIIFGTFTNFSISFLLLFFASKASIKWRLALLVSGSLISFLCAFYFEIHHPIDWLLNQGAKGVMNLIGFYSIPACIYLLLRVTKIIPSTGNTIFNQNFTNLFWVAVLFTSFPFIALEIGIFFNPQVYDSYAMHWDGISKLNLDIHFYQFISDHYWLRFLVGSAYGLTPIGFLAASIKQLNGYPKHVASAARTWLILSGCALIAYSFFPITGPSYIFTKEHYAPSLVAWAKYPIDLIAGTTAPRNGMPSMHFAWILTSTILWWRSGSAWWSRTLFIITTCLTATATIFLGEHYVVDLIVAVPFALAAIALCTNTVNWSHPERKWTVLGGFLTWFVWVLVLRNLVPFAQSHPWFCWVMNGMTALVVILQCVAMKRFTSLAETPIEDINVESGAKSGFFTTFENKIGAMFFASGAATLIYHVLFVKKLALIFGNTSSTTLSVLAIFLGGIAIGTFVGGRFASQTKRPLFSYAVLHGLIAVYYIATPTILNLTQTIYVSLVSGLLPESPILYLFQLCLGTMVLVVPTVLIGATLPMLTQVLQNEKQRLGSQIALLYLVNTAGAAIGALLCNYLLVASIGVASTTLIAAMINLFVALGGLELNKKFTFSQANSPAIDALSVSNLNKLFIPVGLTTLFLGGALSMGIIVIYAHMLSIVAGNSTYTYGSILATSLAGLSIGSLISKKILANAKDNHLCWLAYCFLGLAICSFVSIYFWNTVPGYFASFVRHTIAQDFNVREAIRIVVCALIMVPPTIFIGVTYVIGLDLITQRATLNQIRMLGLGASLIAIGNMIGVMLFGFCLLSAVGGLSSIYVIAALSLILASSIIFLNRKEGMKIDVLAIILTASIGLLFYRMPLHYEAISSGANVDFKPHFFGKAIDHIENFGSGMTSVTQMDESGVKTLLANGEALGNNVWDGKITSQLGFAITSLLHQEKRGRALVVGYNTGLTSRMYKEAGFKDLDIAEPNKDIVLLANNYFGDVTRQVTSMQNVTLHTTDGRNMLLLSPQNQLYDVINVELNSIGEAGVASLYNQEFYQLAKAHMQADGILQQRLQLHYLNPTDILGIIATLRSEFNYVSLYRINDEGVLIATNDIRHKDANALAISAVNQNSSLVATLRHGKQSPEVIQKSILLDNQSIDRYVAKFETEPGTWISNDDNLRLEYSTPKGNANEATASYAKNIHLLEQFQSPKIATP